MEFLKLAIDFVLHIDKYLSTLISTFGVLVYIILFVVVFCETGLVVTPFLPGDSFLFVAGAFAALGSLNIFLVIAIFSGAAILGDFVNYSIGRRIGQGIIDRDKGRFINRKNIEKTQAFFAKHGGKTIIIARFMPIIRTFAPFVAGCCKMHYLNFVSYNIIGGLLWTLSFSLAGYFFGNIPFIKDNFSFVIYGIIAVSLMPALIGFIRSRIGKKAVSPKEV